MKINYYVSWAHRNIVEIRGHNTTECVDVIILERQFLHEDRIEYANIFYHGEPIGKIINDYHVDVYRSTVEDLKILAAHIDEIIQRIKDHYTIKDILE